MRALWLPDVLRAAGLIVVEQPGWQSRGKELDAVDGVIVHHTASPIGSKITSDLAVVTNGNGVAPGPIAQLLVARDGTVFVIASGAANHAGSGGPVGDWLPLSPPGRLSVANARTIGLEVVNNGVGEPWSTHLCDAIEDATAAVLRHLGLDASRATTHNEWAPTRKIDPAGPNGGRYLFKPGTQTWNPDSWRARVALQLHPLPEPPAPIEEDDDMTAVIYRDERFANVVIVGPSGATCGTEAVIAKFKAKGAEDVVDKHDQVLFSYLRQCCWTADDLVVIGGKQAEVDAMQWPADLARTKPWPAG